MDISDTIHKSEIIGKDYAISILRSVSMLMIIACHILQGLNNNWAYYVNVGVQLFFIISGYLYGHKQVENIGEFYLIRFKKILIPYIILTVIMLILDNIILGISYDFVFILGSLLGFSATQGNSTRLSHTWFITYILICYLIIPVLQRIFNETEKFKTSFIKFLILTIFLHLLQFYSIISINTCWINCFIYGYFFSRCCKTAMSKKITYILQGLLFVIIFPLAVILQEGLAVELPSFITKYSTYYINYGHVLLGIVLFSILLNIFRFIAIKKSVVLDYSDSYSYYIYLTHQIFILFDFSLLFLTNYLIINIIIILCATLVSAIILKLLVKGVLKLFNLITKN